jgi:hypothetical protein
VIRKNVSLIQRLQGKAPAAEITVRLAAHSLGLLSPSFTPPCLAVV